jgi:putative sigma-54 modulation protein
VQLIITGKNYDVSERVETYVRRKMAKLDRHLTEPVEARVELSSENTKDANQRKIVQVTMFKNGTIIRGEERSAEIRTAVDAVVEKLDKQVRRYKDKRLRKKRHAAPTEQVLEDTPTEEMSPRVVRVKRFRTPPMTEEEAIEQMELLGHSFFLFFNQTSGALNVLYRRDDDNYGLLEPEVE